MKSRNGYDAIAIRSRAAAGNCIAGEAAWNCNAVPNPESTAKISFSPGHTPAQASAPAALPLASAKNRLRVVRGFFAKTAPV